MESGVGGGTLRCMHSGWVREPQSSGSQTSDAAPGDSGPYMEAVLLSRLGKRMLMAFGSWPQGMLLKIPQCTGPPTTQGHLVQDVEKPCLP